MKKKLFDILIIIISMIILIELIINKAIVYSSIMYSLSMWVNRLIPAMFPFFIISDILINYSIINYIPGIIKTFFKKIFNITDNMLIVFFLSMLAGFPSNARNTRTLYDKGLIDSWEANHILMFSHFANPVFILMTVGLFFLHNEKIGIIILICHYLSNFIVGIICRKYFIHKNIEKKNDCYNQIFLGNVLITAIKKAIDTILLICGIVCTFMLLSTIIVEMFNFNCYSEAIIKGIFEITIGIEAISNLNISLMYKSLISVAFLSFGGISVHMQVISQIVDTDIKYRYFLMGRIIQTAIAVLINYILLIILKM